MYTCSSGEEYGNAFLNKAIVSTLDVLELFNGSPGDVSKDLTKQACKQIIRITEHLKDFLINYLYIYII